MITGVVAIVACLLVRFVYGGGDWTRQERQFDAIMQGYMKERRIPGACVAISHHGKLLLNKGYGRAGDRGIVTPWSLFRIGSVSKVVTAIGVMKLHDDGRLCLDAKVFGPQGLLRQYFPPLDGDTRLLSITVRHLLQHSAGWDQKVAGDPVVWRGLARAMGVAEPPDQRTIIKYMMKQPLQFAPGTRFAYSNFGYIVLGRVIEKISGLPYGDYVRQLLWTVGVHRLKLAHTRRADADLSEVTYYSNRRARDVKSVLPEDGMVSPQYGGFFLENMDSSGGWIASASDLLRLLDSLNGTGFDGANSGGVLRNETLRLMLSRPEHETRRAWYGIGFVVQDGGDTWWHGGVLDGSTSVLTHDESGHGWAVLTNTRLASNDINDLMRYALRVVTRNDRTSRGNTSRPVRQQEIQHPDTVSADGRNLVMIRVSRDKIRQVIKEFAARKYRLTWLDVHRERGEVFFNTVWTKNDGTKWRAFVGLTSSKYRRKFRLRESKGYRLAHVASYVYRRRLRYAVIFVRDSWPEWVTYIGYSPHKHKEQFFKYLRQGFRLVVQSVAIFRRKLYISAIYDKLDVGEFRVRMGLTPEQYKEEFEKQIQRGRGLSYLQAYKYRGLVKFSAIWCTQQTTLWAAGQDMTKYALMNRLNQYAVANVPLRCVTGYHVRNVVHFAALWR